MSEDDAADADGVDTGGVIVGLGLFAILFGNAATTVDSRAGIAGAALVAGAIGYGGYQLVARQED